MITQPPAARHRARIPAAPPRPPTPPLTARDAQTVWQHLHWLALRRLSPDTIYQRRRNLTRLAAALPVPLLQATPELLARWQAALRTGDATTCAYVSHVRSFYAWAAEEHLIGASPARRLAVPQRGRRLPRPIGEAQLLDALQYAPARIRPWLVLAAWAGLRAKEIALLRAECVLQHAPVPVLLIAADATKGRNERIVPMSGYVLAELRAAGIPAGGWMFARRDGRGGPNSPNLVSHLCNKWLHDCGFAATLHQLRHRFGTQAYRATRDLRAVQELLGHSHPSTTAGYAAYESAAALEAVTGLPVPPWWQPGNEPPPAPGTSAP